MLCKLSLRNIRRSMKDYAVYFFTLIIGVSVFYMFNAIGTQISFLRLSDDSREIAGLLTTLISGMSVFVAIVLGLLIVYASRFLMKRRSREFALYLLMGMSKGKISLLLMMETVLIGLGSLVVGLLLGLGLSQLMSALVANLFEADMTAYHFTVSVEALWKTVLYFAVIYLVAMVFNSVMISRVKLIDLIQSGKKAEQIKLKNPLLCGLVFLLAAGLLGYAYYQVGWNYVQLNAPGNLILYIIMGAIGTVLVFWSLSGFLARMFISMKKVYYRGLNAFTFRQIAGKINTMVLSMSVICLMLFVTICALCSSFSVRNSMKANMDTQCPADAEVLVEAMGRSPDMMLFFTKAGLDPEKYFSEYVQVATYAPVVEPEYDFPDESRYYFFCMKESDFNSLRSLYRQESITLQSDEYALVSDFSPSLQVFDRLLSQGMQMSVDGQQLRPAYPACVRGFMNISSQHTEAGFLVVPDDIIGDMPWNQAALIGNYAAASSAEKKQTEEIFRQDLQEKVLPVIRETNKNEDYAYSWRTRLDLLQASVGLGAIVTFLGLYIGLVFLIASGAVLALKSLSESVDHAVQYEMLHKIGAEENMLSHSLFRQTGIFYLLPLLLACFHSIFGMKFAINVLEVFGTAGLAHSIFTTFLILLCIYGGYFVVTYYSSKGILKERRSIVF